MYHLSRFDSVDGKPDTEQVELFAETYFYNLMNILNGFFSHVDIKETAERMSVIPFDELVREQLEGEREEIIQIAVNKMQELVEIEMQVLQSYAGEGL